MTFNIKPKFVLLSSAALALAACGSDADDTVPADEVVVVDEPALDTDTDLAMQGDLMDDGTAATQPVDMSGEGDMSYRMSDSATEEVQVAAANPSDSLRQMRSTPMTEEQSARKAEMDSDKNMADIQSEMGERQKANMPIYDPEQAGTARFANLDRNGDGKLSIAEFAIYDLANINPRMKNGADDQMMPYVSTEAINMAEDDFVRLDENGDYFLSRQEFEPAA